MNWAKYGAWGAGGILAAIAVVLWAQPQDPKGVGLALFIGLLVGVVLRGVFQGFGLIKGGSDKS